jgi:citrate lyase beta subunit
VDCACLDIEDGVAANRKNEARLTVSEALKTMVFSRSERLVRINAIGSGLEYDDLRAVLSGHPDGIVVPKIEDAWQVRWASEQVTEYEREAGWPTSGIRLLTQAKTVRGIINLPVICGADPRVDAVIFGAEDFANDIGATRTHAKPGSSCTRGFHPKQRGHRVCPGVVEVDAQHQQRGFGAFALDGKMIDAPVVKAAARVLARAHAAGKSV